MPVDMRNSRKPTGENALPAGGSSMYELTYGTVDGEFGGSNTSVDELNYTKKTNIVFFFKNNITTKTKNEYEETYDNKD